MLRTDIRVAVDKAKNCYFSLQVNQRLYVNAVLTLVFFLATSAVFEPRIGKGMLLVFLAFWVSAILCDLVSLYKKVCESTLGKAFVIVLFGLCTNFSIALSSQLVNSIVGVDPSKFPHTIALLSILSIPFFVAVGFGVLYFVQLVVTPLLLMFHALPDDKAKEVLVPGYSATSNVTYYKTTRIVQLISFAIFSGFVFFASQKVAQSYESFLTNTASSFLFQMEMYPKAQCAIRPGDRAAFVGDDKILVGEKKANGFVFALQDCKSGI